MGSVTVPLPVDELAVLRGRRSAKWRTYPADVLPLTIAEMDFPIAEPITEVLREAVSRSDTGYAMPAPELGEAVAGFADARWGWPVEPGSVTAVTDVSTGCVGLLRAWCRPGEDVVISPPVYPPFFDWVAEVGARLVEAPLRLDGSGMWRRLDLDALRDAFRVGPAVYILCSPHNPVGRVHDRGELETVVQLAHEYGVRVISNEIHAPLVLEGAAFTPFLTVPGAAEIAVSLVSASKAWNLAGLKCAAIVAGSPAMRAVAGQLPPDGRWRIGHFGVLATVAALTTGRPWLDALLATLEMRRRQLGDLIAAQLPDVRWQPPQATYLAWLDCRRIGPGDQPRDLFLGRGRVALEPGPRFGTPGSGFVRLNFGTSEVVLAGAIERMASALS